MVLLGYVILTLFSQYSFFKCEASNTHKFVGERSKNINESDSKLENHV